MRVKFKIESVKCSDGSKALAVRTMQPIEAQVTYAFPTNLQLEKYHGDLFKIGTVKNGVNGLVNYRNLIVTLSDELEKLYFDGDGNAMFKGVYLDETSVGSKPPSDSKSSNGLDGDLGDKLMKILQKLSEKPEDDHQKQPDLNNIDSRMCLARFNGRQSATEWLNCFQEECKRCEVVGSVAKVKCLRLYLDGPAAEWHRATAKKFKETEYDKWAESFKIVFADRGWSNVWYAYGFKHMAGSPSEFAMKKEALLLDVERDMSMTSRIHHIIASLPRNIAEKIDRDGIKTTDQLINELRRFETPGASKGKGQAEPVSATEKKTNKSEQTEDRREKKLPNRNEPCYKCEAIGRPGKYHPARFCRNADLYAKMKEANLGLDETGEAPDPLSGN